MLTKFRTLASLYRQLGLRWLTFRFAYAFRIRSGLIRLQMPAYQWKDRPLGTWLKKNISSDPKLYAEWRKQNSPKFFFDSLPVMLSESEASLTTTRETLRYPWNPQLAVDEAERILSGEIKYFAHEFQKTGFPPDWHKDPVTGIKLDSKKHWSQLSDEGEVDIKFIWEASRFSFVYALVRAYAFNRDERYAEAFWQLIESWAESNPPNTGPNWMDGQEAALRLIAWTFGLYAFLDSPSTTSQRIANITVYIAAHAQRIYSNTDFAIYTRGNHSISEALGLWMTGLLFPELKDTEKYLSFGRMSLEREAVQQIFPDGSYSMYSLNYHRFVLQMILYAIKLAELNGAPFSESLYRVANSSVDYLYQLIDLQTGQMPVYGSNDGALVLPLNSCDFIDYRPVLQLGSFLTKGKRLFQSGSWDEDLYWLCGSESLIAKVDAPNQANQSYSNGGVYVLHNAHSKAVIRCTDFQERPSHADQLHVDLWWRGNNIACDAGTYLYSGDNIWRNGLAHTSAHNTVIVDSKDQMKMASRFTWVDWAGGKVLQQNVNLWQGEHDGYTHLSDPVTHKRTVLMLDDDCWLVLDHLNGKQLHHYALHWLFCDGEFGVQQLAAAHKVLLTYSDSLLSDSRIYIQMGLVEGSGNFSVVRADPKSTRGWRSKYYGQKEPAISTMLETDQSQAIFWTFFGFEDDVIEAKGNTLHITAEHWRREINVKELILPI
jgi:asparagine synthase (glutamine-hydrolysing)